MKLLIIGMGINLILFLNLLFLSISLPIPSKFNFYITERKKPIVQNLNFNIVNSTLFETLNFTLENLWSTTDKAFFNYQNQDGSYEEDGSKFYPSFNAWSYFTLYEISQLTNNMSYFYNYSIPSLEYILVNLLNKSNYGVNHWCFQNGSLPSTKNIEDYNSSTEKIATYQAWTILALLNAYNTTKNSSYLDNYAKPMLDFLITTLWDTDNNSFYRTYYFNGKIDSEKESWYQYWPIISLLEAFKVTGNSTYIEYANKSINFLLNNLWDNLYGGFYHYSLKNGTILPKGYIKYLSHQAGGISFLTKAVTVLKNFSLINNYIVPTLNFSFNYLWNKSYSQFVDNTSRNGTGQYFKVRPSTISFFLKSILEIPDNFNLSSYGGYILKSVGHIINNMRINSYFCRSLNLTSGLLNLKKYTIEQDFPILILSKIYNNFEYYITSMIPIIWNDEEPFLYYKITFIVGLIATISILNLQILDKMKIFKQKQETRMKRKKKKVKFKRKKISTTE